MTTPGTSPTWRSLTSALLRGENLDSASVRWAMAEVMDGAVEPVSLAGFLVALEAKGPTVTEVRALADEMVAHARTFTAPTGAVDIVGTGGDGANTVNISTMASVVIAASGLPVVKHGNRAASSKSGAADCLEQLGVRLDLPAGDVAAMVEKVGITFCFAQVFHPSMRFAAPARKGLGLPTVFNILGPITNPGRVEASAVGVASASMAPVIAGVFQERGASALVFRGRDGLDELTIADDSDVWEVRGGEIRPHVLNPSELLGLRKAPLSELVGGSPAYNAEVARRVFDGERSAARDAVLLNAAAGITAAAGIGQEASDGFEDRLSAAFARAEETLDSGRPAELIETWASTSQELLAAR